MHRYKTPKIPHKNCREFIKGGLARRLPALERLIVTSLSHVAGKPRKLTFQVCLQVPELHMNA